LKSTTNECCCGSLIFFVPCDDYWTLSLSAVGTPWHSILRLHVSEFPRSAGDWRSSVSKSGDFFHCIVP